MLQRLRDVIGRLQNAASPTSAKGKGEWFAISPHLVQAHAAHESAATGARRTVYDHQSNTAHHFWPGERRQLFREEHRHLVSEVDEARKALLALDAPLMTRVQHLDLMIYLPSTSW